LDRSKILRDFWAIQAQAAESSGSRRTILLLFFGEKSLKQFVLIHLS
jgi:hypothetical protein